MMAIVPTVKHSDPYDLEGFGKLPIVSEGRVLPIDSLARNTLRIVSGHETLTRDKKTVPAVQWILDAFTDTKSWHDDKIFRIDHPDIIGMLHLDTNQKYFSANDFGAASCGAEPAGGIRRPSRYQRAGCVPEQGAPAL